MDSAKTVSLRFASLLLATSALVSLQAFGQDGARGPVSTTQSGLNDYDTPTDRIRAGFVPVKNTLIWGEPIQATFIVHNLGTNEFKFTFGGDYRGTGRHDRFKIGMTDTNGNALPDPIPQSFNFGGLLEPVNLKTGGSFSNQIDLTRFRVIAKPGIYKVDCSFALDELWSPKTNATNPVITSQFALEILERTSARVTGVIDELVGRAGQNPGDLLNQAARFGSEDAVPRLVHLANDGPVEMRTAALGALSLIPTEASLDAVLTALKDSDPVIRAAAASSLGAMRTPRAVDALLDAFPKEHGHVAETILLALGTSKADRAFPVITHTLDVSGTESKRAAIHALVNFGGSNAVTALSQRINGDLLSVRYEIVLALAEKLHQPMQAEWLSPVLAGREQNHEWLDSIRLVRMYAGDQAIPTLLSFLDFDVAWSGRNWWILETGVKPCRNAPPIDYEHDPNTDGTPEQRTKNLRSLKSLKPQARSNQEPVRPPEAEPAPYLKTDPPIDFVPRVRQTKNGGFQINSGYLSLTIERGSEELPYAVSDYWRPVYETAAHFRALPKASSKSLAKLNITTQQMEELKGSLNQFALRLCGTNASSLKLSNCNMLLVQNSGYCPGSEDWSLLLDDYLEAPTSLKKQAKADLIESVRVFSQNYHAGTVGLVEAARKIFTPAQLEQILK